MDSQGQSSKRQRNSRQRKAGEESTDSKEPSKSPAHEYQAPLSQKFREETKEPVSPSSISMASSASRVKQYVANLEKSKSLPPPMVASSDSSSDDGNKPTKTKSPKSTQPPGSALSRNVAQGRFPMSSDDSDDSELSDDSDVASPKQINRYLKYLDGDSKPLGSTPATDNLLRTVPSLDSEQDAKYSKYRKYLDETKATGDKEWAAPKKKLGAPPPLEYTHRPAPPPPPTTEVKRTSKSKKVRLRSTKIAKEDLGILASMLGDDDSEEPTDHDTSSRGDFDTSSRGVESTSWRSAITEPSQSEAAQDEEFVEEIIEEVEEVEEIEEVEEVEESEEVEEVEEVSETGSYEEVEVSEKAEHEDEYEEILEDDDSEEIEIEPHESSSKPPSIRMAAWNHQRQEAGNGNGSVSSSSRISSVTHERQDRLGKYLDSDPTDAKGHLGGKSDISYSEKDDDFSDVWALSVAEESRHNRPSKSDDSLSTAGASKQAGEPPKPLSRMSATSETSSVLQTPAKQPLKTTQPSVSSSSSESAKKQNEDDSSDSSEGSVIFARLNAGSTPMHKQGGPRESLQDKAQKPAIRPQHQMVEDSSSSESSESLNFGLARKRENDDDSIDAFSLTASNDVSDDSVEKFDKPEYQPHHDDDKPKETGLTEEAGMNEAFLGLHDSDLEDIEAPKHDTEDDSSKKSQRSHRETVDLKQPAARTGIARHVTRAGLSLLLLSAIGLPIYFLVFFDSNDANDHPSLALFPTPPTLPPTPMPSIPTIAPQPTTPPQPTPPPAVAPTRHPTSPPTTSSPTHSPTRSAISELREFLISVWPSLEETLIGFSTPQFFALDWLANNALLDTYSQERKVQRFAMAVLYFSTAGENWRKNDRWLTDTDECEWYSGSASGTQCDQSGAYVTLDLDLNNLLGTIPNELALLTKLTKIDLSRSGSTSSLFGSLPSELGLLEELEYISLRGNGLTGPIPGHIGSWTKLQTLDFGLNQFSSNLPSEIGGITSLTSLNIENNHLNGTIPVTIGDLTKVRSLELNDNELEGALPSEVGRLGLLESVHLERNKLESLPSEVGKLVLLRTIDISDNNLQGPIPSEFGDMANLRQLNLERNSLAGPIPPQLGNMVEIRHVLDLSENQLSGSLPAELGRLIFLRQLLLHKNQLTGKVPDSFRSLGRLSTLRLDSNNLTGTVPAATCAVFDNSLPVFATDCADSPGGPEITCSCCMFCCDDLGQCTCQFEGTDLDFLCVDLER